MAMTRRWSWEKGAAWLKRGLRVSIATSLVLTSFGLVAARMSYARATDAAMNFGDELRSMGVHHLSGDLAADYYEVQLNGQPVASSNAETRHSKHAVLDYLQAECEHDAVALGEKFSHLDRSLSTLTPGKGKAGFLAIRREQDDRGFVFCFAVDGDSSSTETLARIKKAGVTGDVSSIGDVRYASVRQEGKGATVVTMWTHGSFNPLAMFPKTGDAPGEDFGSIPRPEGGRRILSGTVVGAPFGVNSYEVAGGADEVFKGVNDRLLTAGWKPVPVAKGVPLADHFYTLGNVMDVGVDVREVHPGKTDVSYVVSRGVGSVSR